MNSESTESRFFFGAAPRKVKTGDATLAVRQYGQGPALLLVHGFPLHGFTWRKVLPLLAPRFTCYVPDLAGKGDSEWTKATDFSWQGHAHRLKLLADALGLKKYSVMGQDTGATIARALALADLQRVERVIVVNSEIPGHRPPWIPLYQFLMKLPGSPWCFRQLLRSRVFLRSPMGFGGCFRNLDLIGGEFSAQFIKPYIESARKTDGMGQYLVGLKWPFVDDLAQRHGELRMPVLLIWGEDDPTFPIALAREMTRQIPGCRGLVAVPKAKLLVHEEAPAEVAEAALGFLLTSTV